MSSPAETPHLDRLVVASKKALQHGEQLCSRAGALSSESAQTAADVLALDAKVRWISHAVAEQLKVSTSARRDIQVGRMSISKLAGSVAKIIERRRTDLEKKAKVCHKIFVLRA